MIKDQLFIGSLERIIWALICPNFIDLEKFLLYLLDKLNGKTVPLHSIHNV